jgi:ribosomal protein S18 acetylase RimI-like enzyme
LDISYPYPTFPSSGIGKMLVEKILSWLGNEKKIKLNVAVYNKKAIKFYEKLGFVKGEKTGGNR